MSNEEQEEQGQTNGGSSAASTALKAAAAAAATGAATYAVKKVRSHDSGKSNGDGGSMTKGSGGQGILASAAATSWEAASDALLPLAEDAAEAAGKYLASHGPEVVRDRIVPKFIAGFNDAN